MPRLSLWLIRNLEQSSNSPGRVVKRRGSHRGWPRGGLGTFEVHPHAESVVLYLSILWSIHPSTELPKLLLPDSQLKVLWLHLWPPSVFTQCDFREPAEPHEHSPSLRLVIDTPSSFWYFNLMIYMPNNSKGLLDYSRLLSVFLIYNESKLWVEFVRRAGEHCPLGRSREVGRKQENIQCFHSSW